MKKQVTFEGNYPQEEIATEWLNNLSKCFTIKKAKLRTYKKETRYTLKYKCKVEVEFE